MSRSRISQVAGLGLQANIDDLGRMTAYGSPSFKLLDGAEGYIPLLRRASPDCSIYWRHLFLNPYWDWSGHAPEGVAHKMAFIANTYGLGPNDGVIAANEQNLPGETGGKQASYEQIAAWDLGVAREWDRLGMRGRVKLVLPGLSPGHSEDQNDWGTPTAPVVGYEIMREAIEAFDEVEIHNYWDKGGVRHPQLYDPVTSSFYAFRYRRFHKLFPGKLVTIGEWNAGGVVGAPWLFDAYRDDCLYFLSQLAGDAYIVNAHYFLEDSGDQPYQARYIPPLATLFADLGHDRIVLPDVPPPPPDPWVPPAAGGEPDCFDLRGNHVSWSYIQQKYGVVIVPNSRLYVAKVVEVENRLTLRTYAAADIGCRLETDDHVWVNEGMGQAALDMGRQAAYNPRWDDHKVGYYSAYFDRGVGEHLEVHGLGWLGETHYEQLQLHVAARPTPPPDPLPIPSGWIGAFADYAALHPEVGRARPEYAYLLDPTDEAGRRPAIQGSDSALLVWNGGRVVPVERYRGG